MKMREERVLKKALKEHVKGGRPVARPRGRWLDAVGRDGKRILTCRSCGRSAEDRGGWRRRIGETKAEAKLKRHRSRKNRRRRSR